MRMTPLVGSYGFVTIFVTYLCFADVGTKISPKPVIPHNPPLHLFRGVGATKMIGLWPNDGSVHLERVGRVAQYFATQEGFQK